MIGSIGLLNDLTDPKRTKVAQALETSRVLRTLKC